LHTIGFAYASKSKSFLAASTTFLGVGGWLHSAQAKYHVFSETVGTVRAAIELKGVFDQASVSSCRYVIKIVLSACPQIAAAEKNGSLSEDERRRLETQAAEKGLRALFRVCTALSLPPKASN
jgi:hypothetical protein